MTDNWYVLVIEKSTGAEVKRMGPMDARKADRVESGLLRNLDHKNFRTEATLEPSPATPEA